MRLQRCQLGIPECRMIARSPLHKELSAALVDGNLALSEPWRIPGFGHAVLVSALAIARQRDRVAAAAEIAAAIEASE
jgi:hypothetical protein